jgi:hypothetical protein
MGGQILACPGFTLLAERPTQMSCQTSCTAVIEAASDNANAKPNPITSCAMTFTLIPSNLRPLQSSPHPENDATAFRRFCVCGGRLVLGAPGPGHTQLCGSALGCGVGLGMSALS